MDLKALNEKIVSMKQEAEGLHQMADAFPALYRNTERILASIKMLEINISDVVDLNC